MSTVPEIFRMYDAESQIMNLFEIIMDLRAKIKSQLETSLGL